MKVAGYCESKTIRCKKDSYRYNGVSMSSIHSTSRRSSTVHYKVELEKSNAPAALFVSVSDESALAAAIKAAAAVAGTDIEVTVTSIADVTVSSPESEQSVTSSSGDGQSAQVLLSAFITLVVVGIGGGLAFFVVKTQGCLDVAVEKNSVEKKPVVDSPLSPEKVTNVKMAQYDQPNDQNSELESEELPPSTPLLGVSTPTSVESAEDALQAVTGLTLSELDGLVCKYFSRYDLDSTMTLNNDDELNQVLVNLCYKLRNSPGLGNMTNLVEQKIHTVSLDDDNAWDVATFRAWFYDEIILQQPAGKCTYPPLEEDLITW